MRAIERLINDSRASTENLSFSTDAGIQDDECLGYANDAQDRIFSLIIGTFPAMFQEEKTISVNAQTESVDIPNDAYFGIRIELVEFSRTGNARDYYQLDKGSIQERISSVVNEPSFYIRRSKNMLLQPLSTNGGTLRLTYVKAIPRLDKRRSKVSSVTLGTDSISSLILDTAMLDSVDSTYMADLEYITIADKDGVVKMKNIPITDIALSTGIVTVYPGFTFESGETIIAGDYVFGGKNSCNISQLPDACERYLKAFMDWKLLKRDSSSDSIEQNAELKEIEMEIIQAVAVADEGVSTIPIIDSQFMSLGGN